MTLPSRLSGAVIWVRQKLVRKFSVCSTPWAMALRRRIERGRRRQLEKRRRERASGRSEAGACLWHGWD